jgi:hypothetical protein
MSIRARPFQLATIEAALRTLKKAGGPRRFLVADEVGLGKTVVASGVIQKMAAAKRGKPLSVLYVCSNLTIARQNMKRLLLFIDKGDRENAIGRIDRPSLMPMQVQKNRPSHPLVRVYQLTPDTAIPTRKGQRRDGRVEERALALVLIRQIAPSVSPLGLFRAFERNARDSFVGWVNYFERLSSDRNGLGRAEFRACFRDLLRELLGVADGAHLPPKLIQFLEEKRYQDLVGTARTALAIAALRGIDPDLVIFDEFQRFRDLTEPDDDSRNGLDEADGVDARKWAAAQVMCAIRGDGGRGSPSLLLLSATPYTPYRSRHEQRASGDSVRHSSDFFDLVSFLANDQSLAIRSQQLFLGLRDELQKGQMNSERAVSLRAQLTQLLEPLMARTERASIRTGVAEQPSVERFVEEHLQDIDLRPFRQMHECFDEADRDWIVPLWQSVPLPLQTLGSRYMAWRRIRALPARAELSKQQRDGYMAPSLWPHPRLRALMATTTSPSFALPWARPSLPWWPLARGWKGGEASGDGKLLVFSRYRAVPTALAGLLSYATESRLAGGLHGQTDYDPLRKHWLKPSAALLELFYPSHFLADLEPLQSGIGSLRGAQVEVRRQLRKKLENLHIRVVRKARLKRRSWELLAALEKKSGLWEGSKQAWESIAGHPDDEGQLSMVLQRWDEASLTELTSVSVAELDELVGLALEAPGVVLLRALRRHWGGTSSKENLEQIVDVSWNGLRNYFNKPWFVSVLLARKEGRYPEALRHAVLDGGFESVLDEHFWYLSLESSDDLPNVLNEMSAALRLRDANVKFNDSDGNGAEGEKSFNLRCHAAVPLTEGRTRGTEDQKADEPLRPDEVRRAFNSPFWPKVLVTTSIGQEGLDLHPWCDSLAHWDLASGPVALEQREGRINRFAGLAIRRSVAAKLGAQLHSSPDAKSPWTRLAELANTQLADDSGLAPWWVLDGASCKSYIYSASGSEQRQQHETLSQERALYRLVLGVPDQDDLMRVLKVHVSGNSQAQIRDACVDLCAYNLAMADEEPVAL